MTSVLREYASDFVQAYRRQAVPQVQSTLAKLALCRTAALGGRCYRCDTCQTECRVHHSCGDRHCPQCAGARRADWMASTSELLIPGVDYFQVVFTIPDKLSALALGNRGEVYDLLFESAWKSLRSVVAREQGYESAAVMVLHTWNQKLEPHAHVHALVPGGGPSLNGVPRWMTSRRPDVPRCDGRYLVNADELRAMFRRMFLAGLRRVHEQGRLKLTGEWSALTEQSAFEAWLKPLEEITWVAYIEPPPTKQSTPDQVLKYLARYLTGGPISDRRLIANENGEVTFWARTGTTTGGDGESQPYTLSGGEFVRRWALHILPKNYTRTRRFGGYSNRHRERYLAQCRTLLTADQSALRSEDSSRDTQPQPAVLPDQAISADLRCPVCGNRMHMLWNEEPASWWQIMHSHWRPAWYEDG